MTFFQRFLKNEDGAVTVDWVVLTGAVLAFSVVVGSALQAPINSEVGRIASIVTDTTN